jgi:hypothetical protein
MENLSPENTFSPDIWQRIVSFASLQTLARLASVEKKLGQLVPEPRKNWVESCRKKLEHYFPKVYYAVTQEWDGLTPINYEKKLNREKEKYGLLQFEKDIAQIALIQGPEKQTSLLKNKLYKIFLEKIFNNRKTFIKPLSPEKQQILLDNVYNLGSLIPGGNHPGALFELALKCKQPRAELEKQWDDSLYRHINPLSVLISDHLEGLKFLKEKGINTDEYNCLLYQAAAEGAECITEWLLSNDIKPDAQISLFEMDEMKVLDGSPLLNAAYHQHTSIVNMLLAKGADPGKSYTRVGREPYQYPLLYILFNKKEYIKPELVQLLLDHGALLVPHRLLCPIRHVEVETPRSNAAFFSDFPTVLHLAVKTQSVEVVAALVEHPACQPFIKEYRVNLWCLAGERKQADVARYLYKTFKLSGMMGLKDENNETILDKAIKKLSVDVVTFLVEIGFNIKEHSPIDTVLLFGHTKPQAMAINALLKSAKKTLKFGTRSSNLLMWTNTSSSFGDSKSKAGEQVASDPKLSVKPK